MAEKTASSPNHLKIRGQQKYLVLDQARWLLYDIQGWINSAGECMKSIAILLSLIVFNMICVDSRADDNSSAQAESSLRICNAKWSALASESKLKKVNAIDKITLVNSCQARSFNASMKCHRLFIEEYDKAANEIKDEEKLGERVIKSLKPNLKICLTKANESAMKDSERLFTLFSSAKKREANALIDTWIKDGSGKIPQ